MRFIAPRRERVVAGAVECAYLAGMEGVPWQSRSTWCSAPDAAVGSGELVVERSINESGCLYIPWHVPGHGELVLATASLMERSQAYNLPVELARGALNRLRNQVADWSLAGLKISSDVERAMKISVGDFSEAVICDDAGRAAELAEKSLKSSLDASELLVDEYSRQMLTLRHDESGPLPTLLGTVLPGRPLSDRETPLLPQVFNAAAVPFAWRSVERNCGTFDWESCDQQVAWCHEQGWRVVGGPLLSLGSASLPDWIYLWEQDFEQIQTYVLHFLSSIIERYRGKVHIWHCAARVNSQSGLALTEEQRLRLVVAAIDEVRRADPEAPLLVSFDQPWGEYLVKDSLELSPLHFADSLVRADLGIAGLGLEFNVGYWPGGTLPRDRIEFSRQIDRWSQLGLPLVAFLSRPSSGASGAVAQFGDRRPPDPEAPYSPQAQKTFVERFAPLLLAKQYVQGLFWNQLSDADSGDLAHGGLLDDEHQVKPVWNAMTSLRQEHFS
jgi:hypothetical protein